MHSQFLYSYCYICTNHFKKSIDQGKFPGLSNISQDGLYWRSMQRMGMYIKVFQFGVIIYDLLVLDRKNVESNIFKGGMLENDKRVQFALGLLLISVGQLLNYAVFKALGAKGVYYGKLILSTSYQTVCCSSHLPNTPFPFRP